MVQKSVCIQKIDTNVQNTTKVISKNISPILHTKLLLKGNEGKRSFLINKHSSFSNHLKNLLKFKAFLAEGYTLMH